MRRCLPFFFLVACTSKEPPPPTTQTSPIDAGSDGVADVAADTVAPLAVHATVRANPTNVIAAIVDAETTPGATVVVEHDGRSTSPKTAGSDGKVSIGVLGLPPHTTVAMKVRATKGAHSASTDARFATGALPFDLPDAFTPTVTSPGLDGYVLVGGGTIATKIDVNLVLDRQGRILWYWSPEKYALFGQFLRIGEDWVVSDETVPGFRRLDAFGRTVATYRAAGGLSYDSHELIDVGAGRVMLLGFDVEHTYDSRPYFTDGVENAIRYDNTFDEVDADGKVYFHFSTYPHVTPEEMIEDGSGLTTLDPTETDIVHANSLDVGPDGNVLMSLRHTSSVLNVSKKDGSVVWRLGGKKSDFTFVDDPLGGFDHQHDARWVPGKSEIVVYDNGNAHDPKLTRVVRYAIDTSAKTARLVWSYAADAPKFSAFAGSVRTLPSGNILISYAQQGTILEIEPNTKQVVWKLSTAPLLLYLALFDARGP